MFVQMSMIVIIGIENSSQGLCGIISQAMNTYSFAIMKDLLYADFPYFPCVILHVFELVPVSADVI